MTPTELVQKLLEAPTDSEHTLQYLSDDFVYVSLNYANEDLRRLMPWAGTHEGPGSFSEVFKGVNKQWFIDEFDVRAAFDDGENVAIFGSFTVRSKTLDKSRRSPFSIFAKVKDGKVRYFQYMEDTFATGDSFRSAGEWVFETLPGTTVRV